MFSVRDDRLMTRLFPKDRRKTMLLLRRWEGGGGDVVVRRNGRGKGKVLITPGGWQPVSALGVNCS